jgi:hypothetical protein
MSAASAAAGGGSGTRARPDVFYFDFDVFGAGRGGRPFTTCSGCRGGDGLRGIRIPPRLVPSLTGAELYRRLGPSACCRSCPPSSRHASVRRFVLGDFTCHAEWLTREAIIVASQALSLAEYRKHTIVAHLRSNDKRTREACRRISLGEAPTPHGTNGSGPASTNAGGPNPVPVPSHGA